MTRNDIKIDESTLAEQYGYCERIKEMLTKSLGRTPIAYVHTYGCQQNVSDSEKLKGWLSLMGYTFEETPENADLVLFNTCAVREHAEERVFGNVGALKRYKKERPHMIIAMCGCMAQQEKVAEKIKKSYPYVNLLFGTKVRHLFPSLVYRQLKTEKRVFEIGGGDEIIEGMPIKRDGTFKAWLPILEGCNNFCTYCIVPYVRGRERSRSPEAVIDEAKCLINSGVKEIMLLGQNVNSYGKGEAHGVDFAELLYKINAIEGDFRIRFMTSHPKDCTERLLTAMRDCEKVAKCLHLPVQSGSDRILKEMNRHYDSAHYLSLIEKARELMPEIEFTSDIIVGFPNESEEDFEDTLGLVKKVGYRALFTFIYSKRNGTPAALVDDKITKEEKSARFSRLLKLQDEIAEENAKKQWGKTVRVLVEEENEGLLFGRDEAGANITFKGDKKLVGNFCNVKIVKPQGAVTGELIN